MQLLCQNHRVFESPCHNLTFSTINDNDLNNLNHLPISHGRGHVEDVKKNHLVEKLLDQGQGPIKTSFSFCKQNVDSKKGESGNRTTESPNKYL